MAKLIDQNTRHLLTAGLITPIDIVLLGAFFAECITVGYWRVFGSPSAEQLVVVLLATIVYFQVWLVALMFRLGVMILRARADINLMPDAAARIAVMALQGHKQPSKPGP